METLPDLVDSELYILSIGLNPSLASVKAGFYFANPRNRFWKALNASDFFAEPLDPNLASCHCLLKCYQIGFTDLIKRPTVGCKNLSTYDYREGSERLEKLVGNLNPTILWFHGKLACGKFLQYSSYEKHAMNCGAQTWGLNNAAVYITPNPSSANATYSLQDISDSYRNLFQNQPRKLTC